MKAAKSVRAPPRPLFGTLAAIRNRRIAMNVYSRFFRRHACHLVLIAITIISGINAQRAYSLSNCGTGPNLTIPVGPSGCDVQFGLSNQYDEGEQTSVALIGSNLVLEVHKSQGISSNNWYHVGKLVGMSVNWGPSQKFGDDGYWPTVVMNQQGYVIIVHSDRKSRSGAEQYYQVGKLDPNGDQNQLITWLTGNIHWDGGFHTSVSMNDKGVIVGVHESNSSSNHHTYYRVGHLSQNTIVWDSGSSGVQYTDGINPHIAINNNNQVVEVHQVPNEGLLHYIRGTVQQGKIQFGGQPRYSTGTRPSVALNDNGFVTELHEYQGGGSLSRMVGKLSSSDSSSIDWSSNYAFDPEQGTYPAISSNGSTVIQTHERAQGLVTTRLFYSLSSIMDRNNWMRDMLPAIGDKTLSQIVVPGSHDAGMYCDDGASDLAQTQDQNLYDQLRGGVRYFDLRVLAGEPLLIYHGGATFTCEPVDRVMKDVRKFMQEGHNEVVILKFSHFLGFGACLKDKFFYPTLRDTIVENVSPWMYKANVHPAEVPLNDIVTDGGKVIVVVDGDWAAPQCQQEEAGFYVYKDWCSGDGNCDSTGNPGQGEFTVYDQYSNTTNYDQMKNDQLNKFASFNGKMKNDPSLQCDLFLLSWTLTPGPNVSGVSAIANRNLGAGMSNVNRNQNGFIPNVLYVDYYERARVTDTAITMNNRFLSQ